MTFGATDMKPYRIEWRSDLTTAWIRVRDFEEHPGDLKDWVKANAKWKGGQYRLVSQHVIEVTGLGA